MKTPANTLLAMLLVVLVLAHASTARADVTFERDVLPILTSHCLACHGGVTQKNGLDMRTMEGLLQGGKNGPAIVAGDSAKSLLWQKIQNDSMPQNDNKVSATNKELVRKWIETGAKAISVARKFTPPAKPSPPIAVAKNLDDIINDRLKAAKIPASSMAGDAEFLRRVTLDIRGRIPTAEDAKSFLESKADDRREKLVERLLAQPEYGQNFATEWVNAFRRISMNTTGRRLEMLPVYTRKLGQGLQEGQGWDALMREAITYSGPYTKSSPEPAFTFLNYGMNGEVSIPTLTGNLSQVMLGLQLQCAECHNHPYSDWKQTDFWGLAAFFNNTKIVSTGLGDVIDKKAKPGEPVAIVIPSGGARNAGKKVVAKFMLGAEPKLDAMKPQRPAFADWLTSRENPFFARAFTNRVWAHFFGRGFVNPLNDFNDANPPSHPEALELLAGEFAASGFDLRHLIRCICLTEAYQRTSQPTSENNKDVTLFSHMAVKVMTPEMLYDSLCVALEVPEISVPNEPKLKAVDSELVRARFVRFFRGISSSEDRTEYTFGVPQALRLMNQANFKEGGKIVARLTQEGSPEPNRILDTLFLNTLSRLPDADERTLYLAFVNRQSSPQVGFSLVLWTLINSPEFVLNR